FPCLGLCLTVLLLVLIYLVYLLVGAAVFQALELEEEDRTKTEVWREKFRFLENYTCLTPEAVEQFVMIEALKHGVNPIGNSSTSAHSNWDFSSSFFFVTTVVTTIGYGNLSPSTAGGQIVCVFYALFGIPLNLVVLGLVGKHLSSHVENMRTCLKTLKVLTFSLSLLIGVLVFLLIPPLVFSAVEGWSYRESIYYSFITLSTIGFGDYVIGESYIFFLKQQQLVFIQYLSCRVMAQSA
uniref:Potassium channel subfamily K member 16-like n=1 Tax=Callorhinchus milii TaxID=7868 RepID=A0A4W3GIB7_CALMI